MKWKILFAILAVMLLVGCAKKVEEKPVQPVVVEKPVAEQKEPVVTGPVPTPATTETITVMNRAVNPDSLTVGAGSTIVFKMADDVKGSRTIQVKAIEFNQRSPALSAGDTWELTIAEAGEYQFIDIIMGSKGTITVVK